MARSFNGSNELLDVLDTFGFANYPATIYFMCKPSALTNGAVPYSLYTSSAQAMMYTVIRTGNVIGAVAANTLPQSGEASSPATATTAAWQGLTSTFPSASSRYCFINQTSGAQNTTSVAFTSILGFCLGRYTPSLGTYYAGLAQSVAVYSAALDADECAALAKGFSPRRIRPRSLVFYAPLVRSVQDVRGGRTFTSAGGSVADHNRSIGI